MMNFQFIMIIIKFFLDLEFLIYLVIIYFLSIHNHLFIILIAKSALDYINFSHAITNFYYFYFNLESMNFIVF